MLFRRSLPRERRGVILLIVVVLLALFAVVGVAFVYYADSEATSSRYWREAQTPSRTGPDESPDVLLRYVLAQYIYDVNDDAAGSGSALRGHSLSRTMYGYWYDPNNATTNGSNINPFNGVGRLHLNSPIPAYNGTDDYWMPNYIYFSADNFVRDPERLGYRANPQAAMGTWAAGYNPSYTYPDLNNMHLAAVRADGTVLVQSFHRPYGPPGFGSLDPSNPNWTAAGAMKYMVMRPRRAEMDPTFPLPPDGGGDVKNLIGCPGTLNPATGTPYPSGNDSIWMDLGYPVKTAPDGRQYKPLFAILAVPMDNRVDVNVHGNIRGQNNTHLSNQGWGKWEVSLAQVLSANGANNAPEWPNLFVGTNAPSLKGRYGQGAGAQPIPTYPAVGFGPVHFYNQIDYDAANEQNGFTATSPFTLPAAGSLSCFPTFPPNGGWGNGGAPEMTNHPLLFNPYNPPAGNRVFDVSNIRKLLESNGADVANSDLGALLPKNLNDPANQAFCQRLRRLLTTLSGDWDRPAPTPWVIDPGPNAGQKYELAAPNQTPSGQPMPFPAAGPPLPTPPPGSEFNNPDWRAVTAALSRADLNRTLTDYTANAAQAQQDRQQFAADIFLRLVKATGAYDLTNPNVTGANATQGQYDALRWLAQLSVNIVDYIDSDDCLTPFNWTAQGTPAFQGQVATLDQNPTPAVRGWVFGTELPRVVLNEAYVEYVDDPTDPGPMAMMANQRKATLPYKVNVYAELHNPFSADASLSNNGDAVLNGQYQIVITSQNNLLRPTGQPTDPQAFANVLGDPDANAVLSTVSDFSAQPNLTASNGAYAGANGGNTGFYVVGPGPFPGAGANLPTMTLTSPANAMAKTGMGYTTPGAAGTVPAPPTLLLRRLACQYMPANNTPGPNYNPYVTVDYMDNIAVNNGADYDTTGGPNKSTPIAQRFSYGRNQPYAADASQRKPQTPNPANATQPQHTFFRHNAVEAPPGPPNAATPGQTLKVPFDWLPHLDRPLISPMELLQVSCFKPHELTQQFMTANATFAHRAPWFDPNSRLYRVLEFLETHDRQEGMSVGGRLPGKIDINNIWDPETFLALCDPQSSNNFTPAQIYNSGNPYDPNTIYGQMMNQRTPKLASGGTVDSSDRPFLSLAAPYVPPSGDPQYAPPLGVEAGFLRSIDNSNNPNAQRLFEVPGQAHPYMKYQLMTKLFNNVTTRSNVFAVWITVGFFQVMDGTTTPPKLGPEIGAGTNQNIRHRMFAVVDRTYITLAPQLTTGTTAVTLPNPGQPALVTVTAGTPLSGTTNNIQWQIQAGTYLIVDSGANQETVLVTAAAGNQFQAVFTRNHAAGFNITIPGNPGPQPNFDYSSPTYSSVVPYFAILQ